MNSSSGSSRRWLILGSVVLFALALCVVGARTQMGSTMTVTIAPGNPPTVSPSSVEISKEAGDQVSWTCPNCGTSGFSVHFPNGTPFASMSFDQQNARSGAVAARANPDTYHYTVTVNGNTLDPSVIVKK